MNTQVKQLIDIAKSQIGYTEKKTNANLDSFTANAGSNNYQKYGRDLYNAGYYNGNKNGYEWCEQFVDWCFLQLCGGNKTEAEKMQCQTGNLGASCTYSYGYYSKAGRTSKSPEVGDQIYFLNTKTNAICHTGIVVDVDDNYVTTVEGNSSNKVQIKKYSRSYVGIHGYGHPIYRIDQKTVKLDKNTKLTDLLTKYGANATVQIGAVINYE